MIEGKTGAKNDKEKEKKFGQANACNPQGLKSYIKQNLWGHWYVSCHYESVHIRVKAMSYELKGHIDIEAFHYSQVAKCILWATEPASLVILIVYSAC